LQSFGVGEMADVFIAVEISLEENLVWRFWLREGS